VKAPLGDGSAGYSCPESGSGTRAPGAVAVWACWCRQCHPLAGAVASEDGATRRQETVTS
jgi:hypothetical protein